MQVGSNRSGSGHVGGTSAVLIDCSAILLMPIRRRIHLPKPRRWRMPDSGRRGLQRGADLMWWQMVLNLDADRVDRVDRRTARAASRISSVIAR